MDDSIKLQRNQALDEYIAVHYISSIPSFLLDLDKMEEEQCIGDPARRSPQDDALKVRKHRARKHKRSFPGTLLKELSEPFAKRSSYPAPSVDIDDILEEFTDIETFTDFMLRIIREKDLIEADIYNGVFMDRKLFSKIRNDRNYQPSKRTAMLLSVALHLTVEETQTFLGKAGYSLTHTSKMDIVVEFFLLQGNYNVLDINEALYDRGLPLLNPNA